MVYFRLKEIFESFATAENQTHTANPGGLIPEDGGYMAKEELENRCNYLYKETH